MEGNLSILEQVAVGLGLKALVLHLATFRATCLATFKSVALELNQNSEDRGEDNKDPDWLITQSTASRDKYHGATLKN